MRDRAEKAVDQDRSQGLIVLVPLSGTPSASFGDLDLGAEGDILVQRADDLLGIVDLHGSVVDDIGGGNGAGNGLADFQDLVLVAVQIQANLLQIENDLRHILNNVRKRGKLMRRSIDPDRADRGAFQRGKQNSAQRVSDGMTESALERGRNKLRVAVGSGCLVHDRSLRHGEIKCRSHRLLSPVSWLISLAFSRDNTARMDQTRLRFGGRQPL